MELEQQGHVVVIFKALKADVVANPFCVTLVLSLTIELKYEESVRKFSSDKLSQRLDMSCNIHRSYLSQLRGCLRSG